MCHYPVGRPECIMMWDQANWELAAPGFKPRCCWWMCNVRDEGMKNRMLFPKNARTRLSILPPAFTITEWNAHRELKEQPSVARPRKCRLTVAFYSASTSPFPLSILPALQRSTTMICKSYLRGFSPTKQTRTGVHTARFIIIYSRSLGTVYPCAISIA